MEKGLCLQGKNVCEVKRIFHKKYIFLILAMLIFNAVILISDNKGESGRSKEYDRLIKIAADCKTDENTYREAVALAWKQYSLENNINSTNITKEMKEARAMALEKGKYADGYAVFIQEELKRATRNINSAVFGRGTFEELNLMKSRYDLEQLKDAAVKPDNGIWLEKLYQYRYIQIFLVLLLVVAVYGFFTERKNGLYYIIRTGAKGRASLFLKRAGILAVWSGVASVLFYLESAVILLVMHGGFEGIGNLALNDEQFLLTSGNLTRLEVVGVLIFLSALFAAALAFSLWFILSFFSNVNIGIFVYILLCGIDVLAYHLVSVKTAVRFLHYINVYYLIYPAEAFGYGNWGYSFGIMRLCESMVYTAFALALITGLLGFCVNIRHYYSGTANWVERVVSKVLDGFTRVMNGLPMGVKEGYKILISQRTIIILLLLGAVTVKINVGVGTIYNPHESTMQSYYKQAEGMCYGDDLQGIYEEYQAEYEAFLATVDTSTRAGQEELLFRKGLMDEITDNVNYMKKQKEAGIDAVVINPYEYRDAFGEAQEENQKLLALINVLAVVVICAGFLSYERKSGMERIACSCKERRRWLVRKILVNICLIGVFEGITYGIYYYKLTGIYDFANIHVPLKSLSMFEGYPVNVSILGFIVVDLFVKLLALTALSVLIDAISKKISYIYCVLVGLMIVLPQLLYMLGFNTMDRLSVGRYVAFLPVYNGGELRLYYIVFAVLLGLSACLLYRIIKKQKA